MKRWEKDLLLLFLEAPRAGLCSLCSQLPALPINHSIRKDLWPDEPRGEAGVQSQGRSPLQASSSALERVPACLCFPCSLLCAGARQSPATAGCDCKDPPIARARMHVPRIVTAAGIPFSLSSPVDHLGLLFIWAFF